MKKSSIFPSPEPFVPISQGCYWAVAAEEQTKQKAAEAVLCLLCSTSGGVWACQGPTAGWLASPILFSKAWLARSAAHLQPGARKETVQEMDSELHSSTPLVLFKHPASHCMLKAAEQGSEQGKGILEIPTSLTQFLNTGKDVTNLVKNTWEQLRDDSKKAGMEHRAVKPRLYVLSYKARRPGEQVHQGIHIAPPVSQFSQRSLFPINYSYRDE